MGLHFQISGSQTLSCAGEKLGYYAFQHDLLFAVLQGLWRVHIFCDHADAGLVVGCNDLILFLAHE